MSVIRKNDGFTLLEVVISIAALSLISVFILQMFIASANLNERARNADLGLAAAITEIDNFKSYKTFSEYLKNANAYSVNTGNKTELYFYYDTNWRIIETQEASGTEQPDEGFYIRLSVSPEMVLGAGGEGVLYGELYNIMVDVEEILPGEENRTLAFISTKKYFSNDFKAAMQL